MSTNHEANHEKYKAAWSYLECAISELESCQVGLDKSLYKTIETITEEIGGCMLRVSTELLDAPENGGAL
jgi:hypothetical protein